MDATPPKVFSHAPRTELRPYIKRFLVLEFSSALKDSHLPDTSPVAGFRFRGDCTLDQGEAPSASFTGLQKGLRSHGHGRASAAVLAIFTSTGALPFLRCPLDEFFSTTVDLAGVLGLPAKLDRIQDQLAEAKNHPQRVRLVEDFLLARVANTRPDALVSAAVSRIEETQAMTRIEEVSRWVGLSQSALERRFRRVVGTSPRRFASIVRLQHVLRLRARGKDFTTIAHAAGYCDQPHFIKDFRKFTGVAPELFFQQMPTG